LGLIGKSDKERTMFKNYLNELSIETSKGKNPRLPLEEIEYLILYSSLPIKVKLFEQINLEAFLNEYSEITKLDALILLIDISQKQELEHYKRNSLSNVADHYDFKGVSILLGMDLKENSQTEEDKKGFIREQELINKAMNLGVLYCFKITNNKQEVQEILDKIFRFFLFKFKTTSSPDLFDLALKYGESLEGKS